MPVLVPRGHRVSTHSDKDGTTSEKCVYGYDLFVKTSYAAVIAPTGAWNIVWFQAADGSIKQARWYGEWKITTILPPGRALVHTPLAGLMWGPQDTFRLYYLSPGYELQEWCWDSSNGDRIYDGALNGQKVKVAPYSKLSAISFGGANLRVYYQGANNKLEEYTYGGQNGWSKGATLPGDALPGTSLAFTNRNPWNQGIPSIRGYFQTVEGGLAEQVWETGHGWTIGNFGVPSAPFLTPITATTSLEKDFPKIHVYWLSVDDLILEAKNFRGWSAATPIGDVSVVRGNLSAASFTRDDKSVDVRIYGTGVLNVLFERIFRYGVWEKDIPTISVGREISLEVRGA